MIKAKELQATMQPCKLEARAYEKADDQNNSCFYKSQLNIIGCVAKYIP